MLVAVDGTGPFLDKVYYREMAHGFIKQLVEEAHSANYYRGPSLLGEECASIGYLACAAIEEAYQAKKKAGQDGDFKLFLAGYSRGGATVIYVARLLQAIQPELKIACMALFDAVDRSSLAFVDVVPGNVKVCYHALRDPAVKSRWYFGNCGLDIDPPGRMRKRTFFTTHAGMGGMPGTGDHPTKTLPNPNFNLAKYAKENPWALSDGVLPADATIEVPTITKDQETAGSNEAHAWMWTNMKKQGML